MSRIAWTVAFALAGCALAIAQPADPAQQRAVRLAEQLRCLVCQNQSIADSNAELAVDLRREIREQIGQGRSDGEIVDFMVQRYGDFVLYRPPVKPTTLILWLGPLVLLVIGGGVLAHHVRQRRQSGADPPLSDAEQLAAARLLDPADREGGRR